MGCHSTPTESIRSNVGAYPCWLAKASGSHWQPGLATCNWKEQPVKIILQYLNGPSNVWIAISKCQWLDTMAPPLATPTVGARVAQAKSLVLEDASSNSEVIGACLSRCWAFRDGRRLDPAAGNAAPVARPCKTSVPMLHGAVTG